MKDTGPQAGLPFEPMTRPRRFLVRMLAFLVCVAAVAALLFPALERLYFANPVLNTVILAVALIGVIYVFRQVVMLGPEVLWLDNFRHFGEPGSDLSLDRAPRLLAPMATMLGEKRDRLALSALATRSLLDSLASRLDESRDITRYFIGLLIFLGLLGTFWGLSETVRSVGMVVSGLSAGSGGSVASMFDSLKAGLKVPLAGMGTAFTSSLFGLSSSLVLGFLDLQAAQAQNRFFGEIEDWLSTRTRLGSAAGPAMEAGEQATPAYLQALIEQMAESLENLQRTLARGEEARMASEANIGALAERLGTLTDQMRTEQALMLKLAEGQSEIRPVLARLADAAGQGGFGIDDASRSHIRNLDLHLGRLIEETRQGRAQMTQDLRSEIKLLARTIAALAEEADRA